MNLAEIQGEVENDLRRSKMVIYFEGKTDIDALFALLGMLTPLRTEEGVIHQGILVKARGDATTVRARAEVASSLGVAGRVFGIIDGDGRSLDQLAAAFDSPHAGPLYFWKAYCIENLVVKTGWPKVWGAEPDWRLVFRSYGPYVALNQVHRAIISHLSTLQLANFARPANNSPLRTDMEIIASLEADKHLIQEFDVAERFRSQLLEFQHAVDRSFDEVHALLDGKWLVQHLATTLTKREPDKCRYDWIDHAITVGGLAEVREWWERVTGSAP